MNARLTALLQDVKRRQGSFPENYNIMSRDAALYRASLTAGRSAVQLRANLVLELIRGFPLKIYGDTVIAGDHLCDPVFMQYSYFFGSNAPDRFPLKQRRRELAQIDPELKYEQVEALVRQYHVRLSSGMPGECTPHSQDGLASWGQHDSLGVFMGGGWIENHSIRDYAKLLRLGYGGIRCEVEAELSKLPICSVDYVRKENFLRAALAVCDAGILLGRRYRELAAAEAARCPDPERRQRLMQMAEVCGRVPQYGARTLREAVQALWFGHLMASGEDFINANSLGRLDQILCPYYEADLAAGVINREQAVELLTELAIKLYLDYDVQAVTLGGCDASGKCAVNQLSYLMLEATREFGEIRDLSVRLTPDTPADFLKQCAGLVLKGGGIPFFFNDDAFIPALSARGIALADARNYAPIGCIELTIPGKANPHAVSGWLGLLKILELTVFGGVDPRSGRLLGLELPSLDQTGSFDQFMHNFQKQTELFASRLVYYCRRGEIAQREFGPLPVQSVLTDDCIRRGADLTDGGAIYNYHSLCLMGVPDTADALYVLKQLVFTEKSVSPVTLMQALRADFVGFEALRQQLLSQPKYGNHHPQVDALASQAANHFIDLMDRWSEPDNRLLVHLFTFKLNIDFGKHCGATPDGRKAGEPLAYSLSAHQGRDQNGVTALLQSIARMPHHRAGGASAAIIDLHPSWFKDDPDDGAALLCSIIQGALALGVGQMQFNVVSAEILQRAQTDPEHYGNIPVRVAGYSQLFKLIEPELQDHIIARHKHTK